MAHLEKKYDDTMTEYYRAFCAMLKRTCGKKLTPDEGSFIFSYHFDLLRNLLFYILVTSALYFSQK